MYSFNIPYFYMWGILIFRNFWICYNYIFRYPKMMGGFQEVEVSQEHREIMTLKCADVAAKMNCEGTPELKIVKAQEQVVAGKFIWFHLVDNGDGKEWSACIFVPLEGMENAEVSIVEEGHTDARNPNN